MELNLPSFPEATKKGSYSHSQIFFFYCDVTLFDSRERILHENSKKLDFGPSYCHTQKKKRKKKQPKIDYIQSYCCNSNNSLLLFCPYASGFLLPSLVSVEPEDSWDALKFSFFCLCFLGVSSQTWAVNICEGSDRPALHAQANLAFSSLHVPFSSRH